MLFLIFHLGRDRYGLSTRSIVQVLPLMELKQFPHAPGYVAGLMNLHGEAVPVIDLCLLATGTPCAARFDTRIVLTDYVASNGVAHRLGVIAERVEGLKKIDENTFHPAGIDGSSAPYLGQVTADDDTLLQLIELDYLLPEAVRALLFPEAQEPS